MKLLKAKQIINESLMIDDPVVTYNLDKFIKNKSALFISGTMGSGKSTLSKKIASKFSLELIEEDLIEKIKNPGTVKNDSYSICLSADKVIGNKTSFVYEGAKVSRLLIHCKSIINRVINGDDAIIIIGTSNLKSAIRTQTRRKHFKLFIFLANLVHNNPEMLGYEETLRKQLLTKEDNIKIFKNVKALEEYMDV